MRCTGLVEPLRNTFRRQASTSKQNRYAAQRSRSVQLLDSPFSEGYVSPNVSSWNSRHDWCISRRNCEILPGETPNRLATSPVLCPTASS